LRGGLPSRLVVRVAGVDLGDVEARGPVGLEAGDDAAGEVPIAQLHVLRRGGDGAGAGSRTGTDGVGGEAALFHDRGVALGDVVHIDAEVVQRALEGGAGGLEGEHVVRGVAGAGGELAIISGDERRQRRHARGRRGEGGRVGEHPVVNGLGRGCELRRGVTAEFNDGFRGHGLR